MKMDMTIRLQWGRLLKICMEEELDWLLSGFDEILEWVRSFKECFPLNDLISEPFAQCFCFRVTLCNQKPNLN